jgi:hypothetical protein
LGTGTAALTAAHGIAHYYDAWITPSLLPRFNLNDLDDYVTLYAAADTTDLLNAYGHFATTHGRDFRAAKIGLVENTFSRDGVSNDLNSWATYYVDNNSVYNYVTNFGDWINDLEALRDPGVMQATAWDVFVDQGHNFTDASLSCAQV